MMHLDMDVAPKVAREHSPEPRGREAQPGSGLCWVAGSVHTPPVVPRKRAWFWDLPSGEESWGGAGAVLCFLCPVM